MARCSRAAAAATDAAILTRGRDFTSSKGTTGIEGDMGKKAGLFLQRLLVAGRLKAASTALVEMTVKQEWPSTAAWHMLQPGSSWGFSRCALLLVWEIKQIEKRICQDESPSRGGRAEISVVTYKASAIQPCCRFVSEILLLTF